MAENMDAGWLKGQREEAGLTAQDFATAIGISRVTLWRYESGKRALPNWLRISAKAVAVKGGPKQ